MTKEGPHHPMPFDKRRINNRIWFDSMGCTAEINYIPSYQHLRVRLQSKDEGKSISYSCSVWNNSIAVPRYILQYMVTFMENDEESR